MKDFKRSGSGRNLWIAVIALLFGCKPVNPPDMILVNGKVITADQDFSVAEAVAIGNDRIAATGPDARIRRLAGPSTRVIDLKGRTVMPGIIDAHLHPPSASVSELDTEIPDLHTVGELLDWIRGQAAIKKPGEWVIHPKLFFTRLKELRQPTLAELDQAAPRNPVFLNGSFGGMINTAAMSVSGISGGTTEPGILRDKSSGKLTGFIRASAFPLLRMPPRKELTREERLEALEGMLKRYNRMGITSVTSGEGNYDEFEEYRELHKNNRLTVRVFQNILVKPGQAGNLTEILDSLKTCGYNTGYGDEWVRIGALKIYLDGGILTGTAYLSEPWGDRARLIFGIDDPSYRGILNYTRDEIVAVARAATEMKWKFTAHITGGGGVDLYLDALDQVNRETPVRDRRFSIIHGNFFSPEAIRKMSQLGIYADLQPAWFYKDADAMRSILGEDRTRYFHPYRSMVDAGIVLNGGSDHMVKWDPNTSVNPYNPFLGMWAMISRTTQHGNVVFPEEALNREEAIRAYTINNARGTFEESLKGSIEPGKLADLVVLSDDILTCPVDRIRNIRPEMTLVGGKIVFDTGVVK